MNSIVLSDAGPVSPQMWLIYAFALLTVIYAVFIRPSRQKKDPLSRSPGLGRASLSRQREVEKQMESLLVELSEMARQITAQLDTRAAKLESLLREADEKIAALPTPPASATIEPSTPAEAGRDIAGLDEDARHSAVYDLADTGMSVGQISQRLSRPKGEVELILALRSRK